MYALISRYRLIINTCFEWPQMSSDSYLNTVKFNRQCNEVAHANSNMILILNCWHKVSIARCQIFGATSFHQFAILSALKKLTW